MVLELAVLNVIPEQETEFENAFREARGIIASMPGFVSLELQRSLEQASRDALLVRWSSLEDHTIGFSQSAQYQRWRALLHHFYDPFPHVEHYRSVDL
jgi:heme-degrading monooxygenase HmoA